MFKTIVESVLFLILILLEIFNGDLCYKEMLESVSSPTNEYKIVTYLNNCGATTPFVVTAELCTKKNKCKEIYKCEQEKASYVYWINNETIFINNKILNIKKEKYNSVYDDNYKDKLYQEEKHEKYVDKSK